MVLAVPGANIAMVSEATQTHTTPRSEKFSQMYIHITHFEKGTEGGLISKCVFFRVLVFFSL